jgi:putative ABC transport system permease protein
MNTVTMAARNLGRNRRRSTLAALSLLIAITMVVFMDGMVSGVLESMARNFTKNEAGHVSVATAEYRARERFMPASAAITDSDAVMDAIRGTPGLSDRITEITPRVLFNVVLSSAAATKAARGIGGDPAAEKKLLMLDRALLPGSSYLDRPGTAILGEKLAADLGLKVGDMLKVVAEKSDYGMGFKKFRIAGLFRTGLDAFDQSTFQVGLADGRELLGLRNGASLVLVMLKDYREADAGAKRISAQLQAAGLGHLSVQSWTSLGDVASLIPIAGKIYFWGELVVSFLGAFIIANVMMMIVLERRREIGILKSMGMQQGRILRLFLAEGVLLGIIGSAGGAILGTFLNAWLSVKGIDFSRNIAGTSIPMDNVVYPGVHPLQVALLFLMGVAVSAIMALLPSRGAARMDPVDAIRSA